MGLCEEGVVKGVPPGDYRAAAASKRHAIRACMMLCAEPDLRSHLEKLRKKVYDGTKRQERSELDVVLGLWHADAVDCTAFTQRRDRR